MLGVACMRQNESEKADSHQESNLGFLVSLDQIYLTVMEKNLHDSEIKCREKG